MKPSIICASVCPYPLQTLDQPVCWLQIVSVLVVLQFPKGQPLMENAQHSLYLIAGYLKLALVSLERFCH